VARRLVVLPDDLDLSVPVAGDDRDIELVSGLDLVVEGFHRLSLRHIVVGCRHHHQRVWLGRETLLSRPTDNIRATASHWQPLRASPDPDACSPSPSTGRRQTPARQDAPRSSHPEVDPRLTTPRAVCETKPPQAQLHFELVASVKLLTELTTLDASLAIVAICPAEGLAGSALTAL
jgi:hypothetical protein